MSNSSQSIWDYRDNFEYDEPLEVNDPRYVDLAEARGSYNQRDILQELGFDPDAKALHWTPRRKYLLFGGHRGCGKSTELRRLPTQFFANDEVIERLIAASGGHPRDLLRLIGLCYQMISGDIIDSVTAEAAVARLAQEYRRLIEPEDYALLVEIDQGDASYTPNNERTRRLLYFLLLLEYNSYWWRSHPVVRELPGYRELADA